MTNLESTVKNQIDSLNLHEQGIAIGSIKASPGFVIAVELHVQKGREGNKLARVESIKQSIETAIQKTWSLKQKPEITFALRGIKKSELAPQLKNAKEMQSFRNIINK